MPCEFRFTRRVEFSETDMAGIVHFSNYFRYLESAEHAFFRSLGLSVHEADETSMRGWARVRASCDYAAPLKYDEQFEIHLAVARVGERSLEYAAVMHALNGESFSRLVARARWTVVSVARESVGAPLRSAPIPTGVTAAIEPAPRELLDTMEP